MGKVPTWGLCAAFPQWYLADLLTGIISPHRLFLIYILRASKLQEHSYSKKKTLFFRNYFAVLSVGYRISASHQALQKPQVVHFDFLIWSQISPCPDTFAFLFTLDPVCFLLLLYWSFLQETCNLPCFWRCPPSNTFQQWTQLQLAYFPMWLSCCLHHWNYTGGKLIWWQLHQILLSYCCCNSASSAISHVFSSYRSV